MCEKFLPNTGAGLKDFCKNFYMKICIYDFRAYLCFVITTKQLAKWKQLTKISFFLK